jgi:tetratricopeptide (TPR) repeat protein
MTPLPNRLQLMLKMQETQTDDAFLAYAIALEYRAIGDLTQAMDLLSKLVLNHPDYLPSYYQLGKMYEDQEKTEEAISIYLSGKKIAKQSADRKTLGELNEALMMLDIYEE